jgi:hypothetical protein
MWLSGEELDLCAVVAGGVCVGRADLLSPRRHPAWLPTPPHPIRRTHRLHTAPRSALDDNPRSCWTHREWRELRDSLVDPRVTVIDHQDAIPGMCCVSAPVWWPNGACAGAVTVTVQADDLPGGLPGLVSYTAGRIGAALQQSKGK